MLNFLVKRLFGLLPTLAIVAVLVFLFVHLLPGDPARLAAGAEADEATVALVRADLGLDRPLPAQFANFFVKIAHGDFGTSTRSKRPVSTEIGERFMPTLLLTLVSMVWATAFGMAIGIASAVWRNRWPDRIGMTIAVSGISFPAFALGMLLMEIFSVKLGWLPVVPDGTWKSYVLPSLTLGAAVAAVMARFTRASFVEVLNEDFVRTARAKGASTFRVIGIHALRNALIPVVTTVGLQVGTLLAGAILTETIFSWPGIGKWLVEAIGRRDYPAVQGGILLSATTIIVVNLVVDLLYGVINPRIRHH